MKKITTYQLKDLIARQKKIQLIDTRSSREFTNGHIEGAINIPKEDIEANPEQFNKDRPIVLYCIYGIKSTKTALLLEEHGYSDISVLIDGIYQWKKDIDSSLFIL